MGNDVYAASSLPESAPIWVSNLLISLQTLAVPLAFWFKPVCVCAALVWLVYRAYEVLNKPLEELATLLGVDIPVTPNIDLANIKADGALVHWSLPEKQKQKSKLKFEIYVNGQVVDTVAITESAVTITGLHHSSYYVVRVGLVNDAELGSRSEPIRFRTKSLASGDFYVASADGHETDHDGSAETLPRVRLYRGLKDVTPATIEAAPMVREGSIGLGAKRGLVGRRPSPVSLGLENKHDPASDEGEPPEGAETIQQLTEKLDLLRRETDEAEKLAKEEEEDDLKQKDELTKERDELKAQATEKDKANKTLRRDLNTLERQNTAAQNERAKQERILANKKQERQKLKDDVVRWERETAEANADAERVKRTLSAHRLQVEQEKEELRKKHAQETAAVNRLDEEVKDMNAEIRKLERTVKNPSPDGNEAEPSLVQQLQQDAQEDHQWSLHRQQLQQQYAITCQKLENARRAHLDQLRYLESVRAERRMAEEQHAQYTSPHPPLASNVPQERLPRRGDSQRSRRAPSGTSASDSPRLAVFTANSQSPFGSVMPTASPGFPSSAPYLNFNNGMTISRPGEDVPMSDEDKDRLTGGAPMSPGAGAELLPAGLFEGEGNNVHQPEQVQILPGLGSLPGLPGPSPLHTQVDHPGPGPASPVSASSRAPSVFASPQASSNNLHLGSPENFIDPDRRSIRSTRSNRATSGGAAATGSRFSSMFSGKSRNKAMSTDEGPALGKVQSASMPRQDPGLPGLDSATRKRNSSISGAVFGPDPPPLDASADLTAESSPSGLRRRAFGMASIFSRDKTGDGWPSSFTPSLGRRPGSPRPGSTHSNELPRPSHDSNRWGVDGWPSNDATAGARSSPLSLGSGWNIPGQSRFHGSRHPSRRPSVQYGASGPPEDVMEDEDEDALDPSLEPHLAPIGTKPAPGSSKGKQPVDTDSSSPPARLNPVAKEFKSFFGLNKSKDKPPAATNGSTTPLATPSALDPDDTSPPDSRKSRDARSMTTTESSLAGESFGGGETPNELARSLSHTNSSAEMAPTLGSSVPSSAGGGKAERFISKLTRKSSSGKFALPTFKRDKSLRAVEASPTTAEDEEEGAGGGMSASVESLKEGSGSGSASGGRGSTRGWSSIFKGKRGGETPSVSGLSLASGNEESGEGTEED